MIGNVSILLIIFLVILVISMIRGWRRGLLGVLFSLVSVIVLIILIAQFTPKITAFLQDNTKVYERIEERCVERVDAWLETVGPEEGVTGVFLPKAIESFLGADTQDAAEIGEIAGEAGETARQLMAQEIGGRLAGVILGGIVFVIAVILAIIVVKLIEHLLKLVNKIPILGGINRFLGIFAGGLEGLILIWVILLVISLFAGAGNDGPVLQTIQNDGFLSFLYESNPLWQLLQG